MRKSSIVSAFVLALSLSACAGSPTHRSTGQYIDDAALTAKVKEQIAVSQGVGEAAAINVDSYNGVVSLSGFVNNEQQVRGAAIAAAQVGGVNRVINNLQLKPQSTGR